MKSIGTIRPLALLLLTAACGATAPQTAPVAAPPPPPAAPTIDLSAAPEPPNTLALVHFAKPNQAVKTIGAWVDVPMINASMLLSQLENEDITKAVDTSQAIDAIVTIKGEGTSIEPQVAVAAGLKSLDDAKAAFSVRHKLLPAANGAFRVVGLWRKGAGDGDDEKTTSGVDDVPCEIAPAFGAASARLVCAGSIASLDAALPYLTRTAPRATFTSDVHIEVRPAAVRSGAEALRKMIPLVSDRIAGAASGSASISAVGIEAMKQVVEAVANDAADIANDVDKIAIDTTLEGDAATITGTTSFGAKSSLLARLAIDHPERADVPPAAYWRLPDDAYSASYSQGRDVAILSHSRELSRNAIGALLEGKGVVESDRRSFVTAIDHVVDRVLEARVGARGVDVAAASAAYAAYKSADGKKKEAAKHALLETLLGWSVFATDAPAATVVSTLRETIAAWDRPGIAKVANEAFSALSLDGMKIALHNGGPVKGAPKGAAHFVLDVTRTGEKTDKTASHGKAKPASTETSPKSERMSMTAHLLVIPDGAETWVVIAGDEVLAAAKARIVIDPASSTTLAKRAGLESIHDTKAISGGFTSPLVAMRVSPWSGWTGSEIKDPTSKLNALPNKGQVPITAFLTALPPAANGVGTSVFTIKIPRTFFLDAAKLGMSGGFND